MEYGTNAKQELVEIIGKLIKDWLGEYKESPLTGVSTYNTLSKYILKHLPDTILKSFMPRSEHEKEIEKIRHGCMLTYGTTHPEIYKCKHEVDLEDNYIHRDKLKPILEVYDDIKYLDKTACDWDKGTQLKILQAIQQLAKEQ